MVRPALGRRLGRYELVRQVGRGGSAVVWQAVLHGPLGFQRDVALKVMHADDGLGAGDRDLVREARLGAQLSHPNVVATHELGRDGAVWFLAMELVRGASTMEVARQAPLQATALLDVGTQVCAGLAHIHGTWASAPLVHRDIKPQNLLVDRSGLVKIADLGIAFGAGEHTVVAGTPGYVAPEQLDGRPEPRSDLFALGATLYRLATGEALLGRGAAALGALARLDQHLERLDTVDATLPGLASVLRRCLQAEPADRWPTAVALGEALTALRDGAPPGPGIRERLLAIHPGLATGADPDTSSGLAGRRDPLPGRGERFVGRADDLERVTGTLRRHRLVSVIGLGGMGKTRLALEVAAAWSGPESARFVDLSEARGVEGVCLAWGRALGVDLRGPDPQQDIGGALARAGPVLWVVDHTERLDGPARELLEAWVAGASASRFLTTGRRPLGVRREREVRLGPLRDADAAALFAARCGGVVRPSPPQREALLELLGGMPLAVELAAARARVVPLPRLLAQLESQLHRLGGSTLDLPARHQSLQACLEGSFELLEPWVAGALCQLAVFEGGITPESASAVLDLSGWDDAGWALDALEALIDASLLTMDPERGRFVLPGPVASFAAAGLDPAARAAAERRHGAWFAQMGSGAAFEALEGPDGPERRRRCRAELDNLVAAFRRAADRGHGQVAAGCALAAWGALRHDGPYGPPARMLEQAVTLPGLGPKTQGRLFAALGLARMCSGDEVLAWDALSEARRIGEAQRDPHQLGWVLAQLSGLAQERGDLDLAQQLIASALGHHRMAGNVSGEGRVLGLLASLQARRGDRSRARATYEAALEKLVRTGHVQAEARTRGNLGNLYLVEGRTGPARVHLQRALEGHHEVGNRRSAALVHMSLGSLHRQEGDLVAARRAFESCVEAFGRMGMRRHEAAARCNLGNVERGEGRDAAARVRYTETLAISRELGYDRLSGIATTALARLDLAAGDPAAAARRVQDALSLLQAVGRPSELAGAHVTQGELALAQGRPDTLRQAIERAEHQLQRAGSGPSAGLQDRLEALRQAVRAAGDPDL